MLVLRVQVVLISFETNSDERVKLPLPNIGLTVTLTLGVVKILANNRTPRSHALPQKYQNG